MARSSDPRRPTEFQRGSKRYHSVGGHVPPGDEVENTRDHERIWFELRRHRSCCCEPDSAGFRYCVGEIADYPTTICGEHLIPSNSLIDYYPGDGYNGGGAGYWALYNGCGAGEADSEPFGFALFYPDGSWRNGPIFTSQSKPLDFLGTGVGWNREFWLPNVTWSFEYWIKPSPTDIASGTQLSAAGSFMNVNDGGIFTFLRTGGGIGFEHAETGVVQSAAGVITADKWHHIVYVRDATAQSFSIYVNGIRRVYRTLSNSFGINTDIYFAPFSGSANSQFTDVARYNVALTPLQIYRHYRAMADRYALNPPDGEEPGGDDGTGGGVIEDPAEFIFDLDPSRILGSGTANDVMLSNGDTAYWESPEASPFELEARKGIASGYAALDSGVLVPAAQLGTGPTDTGLRYLRDDRVWAELEEIIPSPTALGQVVRADPSESVDFTAALAVVWPTSTYFHYPLTESAAPFAAAGSTFGNLAVTGSAAVVADPDEVFSGETVVKCSGGTDGLASAGSPNADIGRSIIGVWLKVDALPAANVTVVRAGAGNFYALQLRSDGKLDLYVNNLLKLTSTSVIPVGEWTFIVYANDGAGLSTGTKLWINGVLDASGTAVFGSSFVQLVVGGDGIEASFAHLIWVGQEHAGNFLDAEALSLYETRRPVWTLIDEGDLNAGGGGGVEIDKNDVDVTAAARSRLNFVEGSNITLTVTDDGANDEVDITIAATSPAGSGIEVSDNGVDVSASPRGRLNFLDGYGTTVVTADDGVNDEVEVSIDLPDSTAAAVGDVLTLDAGKEPVWDTPTGGGGGGGLFDAYAMLREEQASGTAGGSFTSGSWTTRTLNTESFDPAGIVSISANQFTLQPGSYLIDAMAIAGLVDRHKLKIRNVTDGTDEIIGMNFYGPGNTTNGDTTAAHVRGRLVVSGSAKTFELQHRCTVTQGNATAKGGAAAYGVVEVYAEVLIYREA